LTTILRTALLAGFLLAQALHASSDVDSTALQKDGAIIIAASGQVSTEKKGQDWAIGTAERMWVTKPILTGADGYARFQVAGGTTFEVFAHSRVVFRPNPGNPQDLLDIPTGRVRVQAEFSPGQPLLTRIITPAAIIMCRGAATLSIAVDDEDNTTRIDVEQGEAEIQHARIPRASPVLVKAGDSIAVDASQPLVLRRLDRGSLYHYAFHTLWKTLGSAIPGRGSKSDKDGGPTETEFVADSRRPFCN
jgi:ferric-dicitrate binding protein FerR (iron transport regulator)